MPTEPTPIQIRDPLMLVYRAPDGAILTRIHPAFDDTYEGYGLLICDLVRHTAAAFGVNEHKVWKWVERERRKPTTKITPAH